jgi:hypothetical protein
LNWGRLYVGLIILGVGLIFLLGQLDVLDPGEILGAWWPIALILAGVVSLVSNPRNWIAPVILAAIGVAFLLSRLDIVEASELVWPSVIIVVGLLIIFGRGAWTGEAGKDVSSFNIFSGSELSSSSKEFSGGKVSAVFGGAQIDLREASLAPGATIDVFAMFGGIEIRVPVGWSVVMKGTPIAGGFENSTAQDSLGPDAPTLTVNATVLFGAVTVKH